MGQWHYDYTMSITVETRIYEFIIVQAHISKGVQTIEDSRVLRDTRITYRTLCDSFTTLDPIVI